MSGNERRRAISRIRLELPMFLMHLFAWSERQ